MEQEYIEKLEKLNFTGNMNPAEPVLQMRAYHNTFEDITDCSYAVINIPVCYDKDTEKKVYDNLTRLLSIYHNGTFGREHYSPCGGSTVKLRENSIQFEYSWALTEEKIKGNVCEMLNFIFEAMRRNYYARDPEADKEVRKAIARVARRVQVILTFIDAGSTSYEYNVEHYDPLD